LKILVILGSGGHTTAMLKLVSLLGDRFEYVYVVSKEDQLSADKIEKAGEVYFAHKARQHGDNVLVTFWKVLRLFGEAWWVIRKAEPAAIVSAGPGIAVPFSVLGRLLGKNVIFVESYSRVYRASTSGKIIYRFSNLFFVQWPELKAVYPKGIYAGRLA
jgi:beta-1,4-N-acetylglucosaminyltransferase